MRSAFAAFLVCWSVQDAVAQGPKEKDLSEIREQLVAANDESLSPALRDEAREKALWLTIRAYKILRFEYGEPVFPTRVSVLRSPQNGEKISFIPVVAGAGSYAIQNEIGRRRGTQNLGVEESGNFASDGVARIFPSAFSNPSALASTILHELMHFRQATTPGRGDVLTPGESEVEAYAAQLSDTEAGFFPFTDDERDAEMIYLETNLKKKRAQAARERAQVNRSRGVPIDEFSVASLPAGAIKELADKARRQVHIAQADHDKRLRNDLLRLAFTSCRSPGSVFQSTLDDLPEHHSPFFASDGQPPANLGECAAAYHYLLNGGRDTAELGRRAAPRVVPVDAKPHVPFVPAQPAPAPIRAVPVTPRTPFHGSLPQLKQYAVAACASAGQVPMDGNLTNPSYPYHFNGPYDGKIADELSYGLGHCEGALFRRLVQVIQNGEGNRISAQWVQETAAKYRAEAVSPPPPYYDPCRANGNKYCP